MSSEGSSIDKSLHIGIVAGEASGDILGAGLIQALITHYPDIKWSGIGGSRMLELGFHSLVPQDRLAVMGFIEPLKRLPELLSIRKKLYQHFIEQDIDMVIGIDSPDFNLTLEKKLRAQGIKTIHYVSPSVWAWRKGRVKLIKKAVDKMLTLLPFEADFYQQHQVPVEFVGHPLADLLPIESQQEQARLLLSEKNPKAQFSSDKITIACLPGSRHGEVERMGPVLWQAASQLAKENKKIQFLVPALNDTRYEQIKDQFKSFQHVPIQLIKGQSQTVMAASDCVVMASGTTTLEAALLKKPMVVIYKKDPLSYALISRMLTVEFISLPNLLARKRLVPELIQDQASADAIVKEVKAWLDNPGQVAKLKDELTNIHQQLRQNASQKAAKAVLQLLGRV